MEEAWVTKNKDLNQWRSSTHRVYVHDVTGDGDMYVNFYVPNDMFIYIREASLLKEYLYGHVLFTLFALHEMVLRLNAFTNSLVFGMWVISIAIQWTIFAVYIVPIGVRLMSFRPCSVVSVLSVVSLLVLVLHGVIFVFQLIAYRF